jgi:two-component system, NarL family, sensor histidine kinase LiaS
VLVIHTRQTRSLSDNLNGLLQLLALSFALITCLAGIIGTLFGFFTARWLTRRLRRVTTAAPPPGVGAISARPSATPPMTSWANWPGNSTPCRAHLQEVMTARQQLAVLDERNRMARDLHDSVKQQVFAIRMNLGAMQTLWDQNPDKARTRLDAALQLTEQAQQELSELIAALRPGALENKSLAAALPELLADWEKAQGIAATCRVDCPVAIPAPVEHALFRITQEALANIAKHSGAKQVQVHLTGDSTRLALRIADDGRGFDPAKPTPGLGLRSMRERLEAVGGSLEITSDYRGTQLTIRIPVPGPDRP